MESPKHSTPQEREEIRRQIREHFGTSPEFRKEYEEFFSKTYIVLPIGVPKSPAKPNDQKAQSEGEG